MRRCISNRRCILFLLLILFSGAMANGRALYAANALDVLQSSQSESVTTPTVQPPEFEQTKTEQYTLSHDRYEKAVRYSRAAYALHFVYFFLSVLVLFVVLRLGVAAKFRDIAENVSDKRWVQAFVFVPLLLFTLDLFDLPVRIYWHALSLRYEQSVQRWGSWLSDWAKEEVLGIAFALILVGLLVVAMRRSPRRWWLYFWFAALPVLLFTFFISPWFIDPFFYKFEPLDAQYPDLVTAIDRVSQRAGLQIPRKLFLMRASEKTNALNAYVTGFGASKRVVVWDTTIQKLTTDETLFIFGHEAGHYVLHHVRNSLLFFAATLLLAFYLLFRGLHWALHRWAANWKIYGPEDWASLAVLLLLLQVMAFFSSPVVNWYSRMQEHAADIYGLEVIHGIVPNSAEVAAHAFQVLGEVDLDDPNPPSFITFWLYSHPPLADRLVFAHTYDPWSKGEPPKYVK